MKVKTPIIQLGNIPSVAGCDDKRLWNIVTGMVAGLTDTNKDDFDLLYVDAIHIQSHQVLAAMLSNEIGRVQTFRNAEDNYRHRQPSFIVGEHLHSPEFGAMLLKALDSIHDQVDSISGGYYLVISDTSIGVTEIQKIVLENKPTFIMEKAK